MNKIGFIGSGNIARAILSGMSKNKFDMKNIYINSKSDQSKEKLCVDFLINCSKDNIDLVNNCKYIFFAIKSKHYKQVIQEIKPHITDEHVLISLAPGYTIEEFQEKFDYHVKVVRAMPNIPSYVGEGMTGITFSYKNFSRNEENEVVEIFKSFGEVEIIEEDYMDVIVSVSASAPAYVYIMLEAMGDAGVLTGLPRKLSYKMAAQAVIGAAKMVKETDMHPGELKDAVCSPGGTTIEAVKVLEARGFRSALIESMLACYEKAKKLKK